MIKLVEESRLRIIKRSVFMLRLINILEANNIVTCTCLRNGDSKDAFSMKIDLENVQKEEIQ